MRNIMLYAYFKKRVGTNPKLNGFMGVFTLFGVASRYVAVPQASPPETTHLPYYFRSAPKNFQSPLKNYPGITTFTNPNTHTFPDDRKRQNKSTT